MEFPSTQCCWTQEEDPSPEDLQAELEAMLGLPVILWISHIPEHEDLRWIRGIFELAPGEGNFAIRGRRLEVFDLGSPADGSALAPGAVQIDRGELRYELGRMSLAEYRQKEDEREMEV